MISIVFFVWASRVYFELFNPPSDAAEVFVVGKQWMWYLQHPEGKRETNELHVPLGRPVKLTMTSQDVIHSFYVPAFRMKQDVLPGRYTSTWFQPTKTGRFHLYCAEYCGTNHSVMGGFVYVMEPADYERWLSRGSVGESMVTAGAKLFQQYHCNGCHGDNPTVRAPRLEGVFGGPVPDPGGQVDADGRRRRPLPPRLDPHAAIAGRRRVRPGHAVLRGADQRAGPAPDPRLHQVARQERGGHAMSQAAIEAREEVEHYITADYSLKSWLLTTDHKRIGLMYMVAITFFFFVGGAAATLIRLELMTPRGDLHPTPDAYNRQFTLHGIVMIFFFLIPSIPTVLGNFLVPLMLGARDLAFPKLNLLSWYIFMVGGRARRSAWRSSAGSTRAGPSTRRSAACSRTPTSSPRRSASSSRGSRRS